MVSPIVKSRKSESPPTPRKRAISFKADMAPEEVFYRSMKPPCPFCGQMNTKFRYFNNRYRTPGTRISSFDQPRFKCLSPCCSMEFIFGSCRRRKPDSKKLQKTNQKTNQKKNRKLQKNGSIVPTPTPTCNPSPSTDDGNNSAHYIYN